MTGALRVGDWIGDRFEVFDIHEGGMSLVYVAHDHLGVSGRKVVALKTLKDELLGHRIRRSRFATECRLWVQLGQHAQYRAGACRRSPRQQALRGSGAGARRRPDPLDRLSPAQSAPGAPLWRAVLPGHGARPAAGPFLPSRHQARQSAHHRGRRAQDHRFRAGADQRGDGRRAARIARRLDPAGRRLAQFPAHHLHRPQGSAGQADRVERPRLGAGPGPAFPAARVQGRGTAWPGRRDCRFRERSIRDSSFDFALVFQLGAGARKPGGWARSCPHRPPRKKRLPNTFRRWKRSTPGSPAPAPGSARAPTWPPSNFEIPAASMHGPIFTPSAWSSSR